MCSVLWIWCVSVVGVQVLRAWECAGTCTYGVQRGMLCVCMCSVCECVCVCACVRVVCGVCRYCMHESVQVLVLMEFRGECCVMFIYV